MLRRRTQSIITITKEVICSVGMVVQYTHSSFLLLISCNQSIMAVTALYGQGFVYLPCQNYSWIPPQGCFGEFVWLDCQSKGNCFQSCSTLMPFKHYQESIREGGVEVGVEVEMQQVMWCDVMCEFCVSHLWSVHPPSSSSQNRARTNTNNPHNTQPTKPIHISISKTANSPSVHHSIGPSTSTTKTEWRRTNGRRPSTTTAHCHQQFGRHRWI